MDLVKLVRYSDHGFEPQHQSKMRGYVEWAKSYCGDNLEGVTNYVLEIIKNNINETLKNLNQDFEFQGIHAFFDPVSIKDRNFFMNHLSYLPKKHKAMIPSSALAYSLDEPYTSKPMPISDFQKDWRFHYRVGVYIPASSLRLIKEE
jgi:hypothetical protein